MSRIGAGEIVAELGCGYGRVMKPLSRIAGSVIGVDTSFSSLHMAREYLAQASNCHLLLMNAVSLGLQDRAFDAVICIQNGISAFQEDPHDLLAEGIRVTRPGGRIIFSSYSARFWKDRLEWFELQASEGLLGEIDYDATYDGVIVCRDGFRASTFGADDFRKLASEFGLAAALDEVDDSSLFCEVEVHG